MQLLPASGAGYLMPSISIGRCRGPRSVGFCRYGGGSCEEAWVLQPAGELGQRDLRLLAREAGAEAVVDAGEEAEVLVVLPLGIEPVGIAEAVRVPVGGGQREAEARALRDRTCRPPRRRPAPRTSG